ncbi:DNA-formamidopyrimidine glycosylase [Spiroplasma endosymbiont of Crioceris asparagi]|uniref:DNA-formamidopyrimidine glycosylase n=1 Tax=Spiroplasma endosymbiont of Crioceris asparagi TaxID=3066286 RepID=UPI0030CB3638
MPELPEVESVRAVLENQVKNKTIDRIKVIYNKLLKDTTEIELNNKLKDKKIINVNRKAKYLIFEFEKYVLISHLRMEGKWYFYNDLNININKHAEFIFYFNDKTMLVYFDTRKFGTLNFLEKDNYFQKLPLNKLGPDANKIENNFTPFYKKISKSSKNIKTILLDQTIIAGLGNIYVNEVLFAAKILPFREGKSISEEEMKTILNESQMILNKAIKYGGTTISTFHSQENSKGGYQQFLKVHLRVNKPCFTCGTLIKKIAVNGRGTYYCELCQK